MVVEPLGATLGSLALLFPIYDNVNRLYRSCGEMKTFGRDVQILYLRLEMQWCLLYRIMRRRQNELVSPIDPDDENHVITSSVKSHLSIIETYFIKCEQIMKREIGSSSAATAQLANNPRIMAASSLGLNGVEPQAVLQASLETASNVEQQAQDTPPAAFEASARKKNLGSRIFRNFFKRSGRINPAPSSSTLTNSSLTTPALTPISTNASTSNARSTMTNATSTAASFRNELLIPEMQNLERISQKQSIPRNIESTASVWRQMKWTHHSKEEFESYLEKIRAVINDLGGLTVPIKDARQPEKLLSIDQDVTIDTFSTSEVRNALDRAHTAFQNPKHIRNGHTLELSVGIARSLQDSWSDVRNETDLSLRSDSFISCIQYQLTDKNPHESLLLMVESTKQSPKTLADSDTVRDISSLHDYEDLIESPQAQYVLWGRIQPAYNSLDHHHVFVETQTWRYACSLADILEQEWFQRKLDLRELLRLVDIILIAHLDFAEVFKSTSNPRLESFAYFREPPLGKMPEVNGDDNTAYLQPYLSFGFGQRVKRGRLGAMDKSATKDQRSTILELGFILYQLGSHEKLYYSRYLKGEITSEMYALKKTTTRNLNKVEKIYGSRFANVVEVCLTSMNADSNSIIARCVGEIRDMSQSVQ